MHRYSMISFALPKCYLGFCRYGKDVKLRVDVRTTMLQRIDALANAVGFTLGPKARNIIIDQGIRLPKVRKEGATIAQTIELRNKLEDIGAKLMNELACKTKEDAGNGVNTIAVLARAIANAGFEKISVGANPIEIRRGVMLAANEVRKHLKLISRPIGTKEEIEQVADIYANGDKAIKDVVCEAIGMACRNGVICIRQGKGQNDELHTIKGMKFNSGFVSPYFINTPHGEKVDFQNALLLLTANRISSIKTIMPVLELASSKRIPLVIMANDFTAEALTSLVISRLRTGLSVVAVKAPGFGDNKMAILNDIAIATGGAVFGDYSHMARLEDIKLKDLGKVCNAIISKNETLLLNGMGERDNILRRIDQMKNQLAVAKTPLSKHNLRARLTNLVSDVVLVDVGGSNELEINNKIKRIKIALNATRAAIEEGIVPGGGIALLKCIPCLNAVEGFNDSQRMGIEIVRHALRIPCLTLATNAGVNAAMLVAHIENENGDYDAFKAEFEYLAKLSISDPTKVVRTAITDAAGVASLLMTAETAISDMSKEKA